MVFNGADPNGIFSTIHNFWGEHHLKEFWNSDQMVFYRWYVSQICLNNYKLKCIYQVDAAEILFIWDILAHFCKKIGKTFLKKQKITSQQNTNKKTNLMLRNARQSLLSTQQKSA